MVDLTSPPPPRKVHPNVPPPIHTSPVFKRQLPLWQLPWRSQDQLLWILGWTPSRSCHLTLMIQLQRTCQASTFPTFLGKQMMGSGDSQLGWPRPSRMMNNNNNTVSSVKVLTTLPETAPKQKMYEGPCSQGGLPKQQQQTRPKHRCQSLHLLSRLLLQRREPSEGSKKVPCLKPDPFMHLISPKNWVEAYIDNKLTTCLLDNGAQLNFMTPYYAIK